MRRLQAKIGRENFYLGLEWGSGQWLRELGAAAGVPLAWAQALRWTGDARKYAVARAVFQHLPLPETFKADTALDGLLPARPLRAASGRTAARPWPTPCAWPSAWPSPSRDLEELFPDGGNELETWCGKSWTQRRAGHAERERALQELQVIRSTGAAAYFLIAGEIADFCRQQRIFFSLRGSGGASFVLFLLGMSRIDPLGHGLLFERFVNSQRDDLPDIDVDIDSSRRARFSAGCSSTTAAGRPLFPATSFSAPARPSTKRPAPSASTPTRPTP